MGPKARKQVVLMPWTRKQVKYLFSKVSPLSGEQKEKMQAELHENPELGHAKKGFNKTKKQWGGKPFES